MTIREQLEQREHDLSRRRPRRAPRLAGASSPRGRTDGWRFNAIATASFIPRRSGVSSTRRRSSLATGDHSAPASPTRSRCRPLRGARESLRLHEDLTETIALGHDLGHTPFGHAGERILRDLIPAVQPRRSEPSHCRRPRERGSRLEPDLGGARRGIARHSKGKSRAPVGADKEHRASTMKDRSRASPTSSAT